MIELGFLDIDSNSCNHNKSYWESIFFEFKISTNYNNIYLIDIVSYSIPLIVGQLFLGELCLVRIISTMLLDETTFAILLVSVEICSIRYWIRETILRYQNWKNWKRLGFEKTYEIRYKEYCIWMLIQKDSMFTTSYKFRLEAVEFSTEYRHSIQLEIFLIHQKKEWNLEGMGKKGGIG